MPASIDHMTTNFARIESGHLDHKRENADKEAAKVLKGLYREARREVTANAKAQAKEAKTEADVTDEALAQKIWDLTIAKAVDAGVQTSIPGTRGNVFRAEARKAAKNEMPEATPAEADSEVAE